jgi:hypothetical protein
MRRFRPLAWVSSQSRALIALVRRNPRQHFVAITRAARARATFVPYSQHFVAITRAARARATFVPYSQRFAAFIGGAPTIATKYCPRSPPSRR